MINRRFFIKSLSLASGAAFLSVRLPASISAEAEMHIACQQYTWFTYYKREGKNWMEDVKASFRDFVASGLRGYEPSFENAAEVSTIKAQMNDQKVWAKSMYVNSVLHEPLLVEKNISKIMAIAEEAKKIGVDILVTNPTPIRWGGLENKSDDQLKTQAIALNLLGKKLSEIGIVLAYHNHDAEMRESAREFHHMLSGTDPANVKLCLDAHWIYRGSGNSQVALFDIVEIYADRIVELHLRQSHDGIWSEVFGKGDINYIELVKTLYQKGIKPHVVLEQAIEEGTPHTMGAVEAMKHSLSNTKSLLKFFK